MAPHLGHFWSGMAGALLCVLRARFFRLEVRRFGTAIGQVALVVGYSVSVFRLNAPQRVPARIARRVAVAGSVVQVFTARRAQAFAFLPADGVSRNVQHPLLADDWTQIELVGTLVQHVYVGIVRLLTPRFSE